MLFLRFIKYSILLEEPQVRSSTPFIQKLIFAWKKRSQNLQGLKYLFWGSLNVLLSWVIYFVSFHFVISKNDVQLFHVVTISGHIFSFLLAFTITFFTGFFLNHYFVFNASKAKPIYHKLFRYFLANIGSLFINYILLKLFVEYFMFYPTPSQILCTFFVTIYSFFMQKKFTFRQ